MKLKLLILSINSLLVHCRISAQFDSVVVKYLNLNPRSIKILKYIDSTNWEIRGYENGITHYVRIKHNLILDSNLWGYDDTIFSLDRYKYVGKSMAPLKKENFIIENSKKILRGSYDYYQDGKIKTALWYCKYDHFRTEYLYSLVTHSKNGQYKTEYIDSLGIVRVRGKGKKNEEMPNKFKFYNNKGKLEFTTYLENDTTKPKPTIKDTLVIENNQIIGIHHVLIERLKYNYGRSYIILKKGRKKYLLLLKEII